MSMPGRFIVLEGGEGAGKSTQMRAVQDWLEAQGRRTQRTREPGGSPLAEAIRNVVLGTWTEGMDATTEALLIFAARAAHLRATILPVLQADTDVISDRFVDSSYAYQGAGRGLGFERIAELERMVLGDVHPDLVIVLDIEPEVGLARIRARGSNNRFDEETLEFMHRVRAAYLQRAVADPHRHAVIDAAQPLAQVSENLLRVLESRL